MAMEDLALDVLGPLTSGLLVVCLFLCFLLSITSVVITKLKQQNISQVGELLMRLKGCFFQNELSLTITSNNRPQFRFETFENYSMENGIKRRGVTP